MINIFLFVIVIVIVIKILYDYVITNMFKTPLIL